MEATITMSLKSYERLKSEIRALTRNLELVIKQRDERGEVIKKLQIEVSGLHFERETDALEHQERP